jgi:hypothetical protein
LIILLADSVPLNNFKEYLIFQSKFKHFSDATTLSIMTFSILTLCKMALSLMTLSLTTREPKAMTNRKFQALKIVRLSTSKCILNIADIYIGENSTDTCIT